MSPGRYGNKDPRQGIKLMRFDSLRWLTGYSGWTLYCAVVSLLGLTAYYSDLLRPRLPAWVVVGLFTAPVVIILFIQWGEAPDRVVALSHKLAASLFMLLALGMEIGILLGYEPKGATLYRVFAHAGWTFAWAGIYRRARLS